MRVSNPGAFYEYRKAGVNDPIFKIVSRLVLEMGVMFGIGAGLVTYSRLHTNQTYEDAYKKAPPDNIEKVNCMGGTPMIYSPDRPFVYQDNKGRIISLNCR